MCEIKVTIYLIGKEKTEANLGRVKLLVGEKN